MGRTRVEINPESGKRLKEYLVKHRITQAELAERLGYDTKHISNICTGLRRLTPEMAQRIQREYGNVSADWLLCNEENIWNESENAEVFYNRIFRCFIDGIEDISGYGLHSLGSDILIGDYIIVSDKDGKKVGAITEEMFDSFRREIENYASYQLQLLVKNHMEALPLNGGEV